MKQVIFILSLAFAAITFTSCNKDIKQCVEDLTGSYSGTQSCYSAANYTVVLGQGNEDDEVIINFFDSDNNEPLFGIVSNVDEDCNITINEQVLMFDTYDVTFSGSGTISDNQLTINLTQTIGLDSNNCIFELSR